MVSHSVNQVAPKILVSFNHFITRCQDKIKVLVHLDLFKFTKENPRFLAFAVQCPRNYDFKLNNFEKILDDKNYGGDKLFGAVDFNNIFNPYAQIEEGTKRNIFIKNNVLQETSENRIFTIEIDNSLQSKDPLVVKFLYNYYDGTYRDEFIFNNAHIHYSTRKDKQDFRYFIKDIIDYTDDSNKDNLRIFFAENHQRLCDALSLKD